MGRRGGRYRDAVTPDPAGAPADAVLGPLDTPHDPLDAPLGPVGAAPDPLDAAHDRLGAAVRAVVDSAVRCGADAATLDEVAADLERLRARLDAAPRRTRIHDTPYHPMSLVGGTAHPVAPQLHTSPSGDGVTGSVTLPQAYEGGPGLVHGGILALLLDHAMGQAVFVTGSPGMTVSLELRYLAPTPLDVPLQVSARVEGRAGRKRHVTGEVSVGGVPTVEARALFVALSRDTAARIFPTDRLPGA